jgi:hypothetical protein
MAATSVPAVGPHASGPARPHDPQRDDLAWNETVRIATLVGLYAQAFLDEAALLFPTPVPRRHAKPGARPPAPSVRPSVSWLPRRKAATAPPGTSQS